MFGEMENHEMIEPRISSPNKSFIVELFHKSVYSDAEKLWLDNFQGLSLTREQKAVIRLGMNGRLISPKEIFDSVGITDTQEYTLLVTNLINLGVLKRVIDRNRAYHLAKQESVPKRSIGIYKIQIPEENR